jgi:hypothetical protein
MILKKTITCEERDKKQNNNNNNERHSSSSRSLSSESNVISIKMSLVDFQLFLLLFSPRERENKDASSPSFHVMTFGMYMYICSSTSSVSHESAIINRHILVQQEKQKPA